MAVPKTRRLSSRACKWCFHSTSLRVFIRSELELKSPTTVHKIGRTSRTMATQAASIVLMIFVAGAYISAVQGTPAAPRGRIVNGQEATPHAWPWQVSVLFFSVNSWYHKCGGSLIDAQWVMTAAHCYSNNTINKVWLGKHNLGTHEVGEIASSISLFITHPSWNPDFPEHGFDIALIKLAAPVSLSNTVQVAALPGADWLLQSWQSCYATGWGRLYTNGTLPRVLQQVALPVLSYDTCSRKQWWGSLVTENMVCAGDAQHSTCQGDSGGPLNCRTDTKWMVYGITSFGPEICNTSMKPSVFTRVSAFKRWITSTTDIQFPNDITTTTATPKTTTTARPKLSSAPTSHVSLPMQLLVVVAMGLLLV
ncbi:chymotrypsin-like elastase family member 2A isoform X2 [Lethenteron reissneri]|uniref:chymotrypsin-like elastase family member 2A isoform X2 n=1 Tax=Lethenteron reissneri TaxID=7753 RepID=UPI002AB7E27A|nr:chymotrypsin-like elastase family member 2A isoform X2 [Lethenteron reissneri]